MDGQPSQGVGLESCAPYAWRREETGTLFDDLYDFYKNEKQDENYFLGDLIKQHKTQLCPLTTH